MRRPDKAEETPTKDRQLADQGGVTGDRSPCSELRSTDLKTRADAQRSLVLSYTSDRAGTFLFLFRTQQWRLKSARRKCPVCWAPQSSLQPHSAVPGWICAVRVSRGETSGWSALPALQQAERQGWVPEQWAEAVLGAETWDTETEDLTENGPDRRRALVYIKGQKGDSGMDSIPVLQSSDLCYEHHKYLEGRRYAGQDTLPPCMGRLQAETTVHLESCVGVRRTEPLEKDSGSRIEESSVIIWGSSGPSDRSLNLGGCQAGEEAPGPRLPHLPPSLPIPKSSSGPTYQEPRPDLPLLSINTGIPEYKHTVFRPILLPA
ncbi:uncharacterized protein LOC117088398 [Trachypithecus francoisi]|uniref:uncharacterized protein LOC117088398 n=1 Tax=Trachypithecus francoisi TaxID=54180 RepID=UPI00141B60D3|nr:uncharacterized protein LOC117088398 [Trachypithecus francoisi]